MMIHRTCARTFILVAAALSLAACSDNSATAPVEELDQAADVGKSNTTPNDSVRTSPTPITTTPTPPTTPRDTAVTPPPTGASFTLSGKVLGLTRTTSASRDTLRHDPIPGVPLRIMRNLLVDGKATQTLAGETTSDANGDYRVTGLPGGYYVVYANPAAGSAWAPNHALVAGTTPNVTAHIYLGRR